MIVRRLYLKKETAKQQAEEYAKEVGGYVKDRYMACDDRSNFDYIEDSIPCWSGEVAAFPIIDKDYQLVGLFAWFS